MNEVPGMSLQNAGRIGFAALLATTLAALVFLVHVEFSVLADRATQIDEDFFSACAARGLGLGALPFAGCHDNKAPLIYVIYEILFKVSGLYNFTAVKFAALVLVALNIALLAALAFRLAGAVAAIMTASLALTYLTVDVGNLALKTELVGGLFVICALWVLSAQQARKSIGRLALAGLLIGLAVVSKQLYAFAGFGVIFWLLLCSPVRSPSQFLFFLGRSTLFGVFVIVPFAAFWLVFALRGTATDYLLSFFLYPAVYGDGRGFSLATLVRHALTIAAGLREHTMLLAMSAAATTMVILTGKPSEQGGRFSDPRWLFLIVMAFLISALIVTPMWLPYYVMFAGAPMALLSGIVFADYWKQAWQASPPLSLAALVAIAVGAAINMADIWHRNGVHDDLDLHASPLPAKASPSARYAYQLGDRPDFYAMGGFIPASSVQFHWALPGTPDNWSYTKPRAGTFAGRMLDVYQARNLRRLYADFERTPPRYILLQSNYARAADSTNATDIPGFQNYLDHNCKFLTQISVGTIPSVLFECAPRE
jgi:hypothetical protein